MGRGFVGGSTDLCLSNHSILIIQLKKSEIRFKTWEMGVKGEESNTTPPVSDLGEGDELVCDKSKKK